MQLQLSPAGRLRVSAKPDPDGNLIPAIQKAFLESLGAGLFALCALKSGDNLPADLHFWRQLACLYLQERCRAPVDIEAASSDVQRLDALAFRNSDVIQSLLDGAPPMIGAEYLSVQVLASVWETLDTWLCDQLQSQACTLTHFLSQQAPHWRQVGRVCFNLAENKRDPDFPFAFMATYIPQLSGRGTSQHQPLSKALQTYSGVNNKKALLHLLSPLQLACEKSAWLKTLVDSGDIYHPLAWTPLEAHAFLKNIPAFEDAGIMVRVPDWWHKRARPQVKISIGDKLVGKFGVQALLDFNARLSLGDEALSPAQWKALMESEEGLVLLKGQWIEIDKEQLKRVLQQWETLDNTHTREGISFVEGMRLLAGAPMDLAHPLSTGTTEWPYAQAGDALQSLLNSLGETGTTSLAPLASQLNATLRPYQTTGVQWLARLVQLGLGACLADDMGLGKTLQVIALLLLVKQARQSYPSLLVVPASLLGNWKAEMDKFAPSLRYLFVHPSFKPALTPSVPLNLEESSPFEGLDLVITTYGTLVKKGYLRENQWHLAILDEAQAIKNPASLQTKAVKELNAASRLALTGTPVENRLADLWSLFDFILPGLLGSADRFKKFVKLMAERPSDQYAPLRKLIQPYILRRMKTDKTIIADLPDKTEINRYCTLTKQQASLYGKSVRELSIALERTEGIQRRGLVLSFLMRLKQICNHPAQVLGAGDYQPAASGKFVRLVELCSEIASRQEKVLVFTQFREMTAPLSALLASCFDEPGLVLHGETPVAQRKKLVDLFQQEDGPPYFVLSLKAGGVGLNLTQASHVIHFDRWWNPAVENQATDRAFRIGQKRKVLVHKFVCQGTLEEKIDNLLTDKSRLTKEIFDGGAETLLTEMTNEQLMHLVALNVDRLTVDE